MPRTFFVYIMTNRSGTLYVGVTNDLERRVFEHKEKLVPGFTARYRIDTLVFFETTEDVRVAIDREKQIKSWRRKKKVLLINSMNPSWRDLSADWTAEISDGSTPSLVALLPSAEGARYSRRFAPRNDND
jgi:putative endonuclease